MKDETKYKIMQNRELLKAYNVSDVNAEATDQEQKLAAAPYVKDKRGGETITLTTDFDGIAGSMDLYGLLKNRVSRRKYSSEALTLRELSFLLWATQGIRKVVGKNNFATFRNVPSAGSRHAFETYLFVSHVDGLDKGIYHYLPMEHALEVWDGRQDFEEELTHALCGQRFAASAPVTFVWSAGPYRMEWRYGLKAHKYILLDAGHVCENLYLACEAVGCGTCAIGAYDQDALDELLGFAPGPSAETDYECAVYAAGVGKAVTEE